MAEHVLKVENLTMQFGGVIAVNNFSMEVNKGETVALIGPNGAGKTTAFNAITGIYEPTNGAIYFKKISENTKRLFQKLPISLQSSAWREPFRTSVFSSQ